LFVFDAGTGIRMLGEYLEHHESKRWRGSLFFTHYHWDHIQGLPFFAPARRAANRFKLYGEDKQGIDFEAILSQQMQEPYFPVGMEESRALVDFSSIGPGERFEPFPGFEMRTQRLRHPSGAMGYRLEAPEGSLCVITDHEHPADRLDPQVVEFARGCSVLVHEAQYSPQEKRGPKAGWGHSSWEEAALTAKHACVQKLFLSHHDPGRSDAGVLDFLSRARSIFPATEVATESTVCDFPRCGMS
jgi:phosphoribosyl 1,2-cyclic phosphodiesterase